MALRVTEELERSIVAWTSRVQSIESRRTGYAGLVKKVRTEPGRTGNCAVVRNRDICRVIIEIEFTAFLTMRRRGIGLPDDGVTIRDRRIWSERTRETVQGTARPTVIGAQCRSGKILTTVDQALIV
jgi:hypothetical protein